jgi:hypothetical protein
VGVGIPGVEVGIGPGTAGLPAIGEDMLGGMPGGIP